MKAVIMLILALACAGKMGAEANRPSILADASQKEAVRTKISAQPWASEIFSRLKSEVDPYADRHASDPQWILSRMAMYWKDGERYTQCYLKDEIWERGEGNAPVPTVRMPGMRTWNKYANVPLEERTPYNETGDMWALSINDTSAPKTLVPYRESGHLIRGNNVEILTLAEKSAFLYWLTEEEKYAKLASDIFYQWMEGTYYMNPIINLDESKIRKGFGLHPGGIVGYYDYEQIHDDLALHAATAYDFAYGYIKAHPSAHMQEIGMELEQMAGVVFKRFVDIGFVRGGKSGNWNVNGWNMMLKPILALEDNDFYADGKGRQHYLHYLTSESTMYHDAIPDIIKGYNKVTGLWPESPGYSFSTIDMLLDFAALLKRQDIDIIAENPILQKAAMAVFPWMDGRGNMIIFGDSRGGPANFQTLERLLKYYAEKGDADNAAKVSAALNAGISGGGYDRGANGIEALLFYEDAIPASEGALKAERTSHSAHHRVVTMKGKDPEAGLMAVLYGGKRGFHLSANGLALQLYGFGYALAPDASGYESYWSADNRYHQSATGSNTILPGYEEGEVTINHLEPYVGEDEFVNSTELNPHINMCDMAAGEKRRVVALIGHEGGQGYYVDLFRSGLEDNDYLFHNVGKGLSAYGADGSELQFAMVDSIDKKRSDAYDWFKNVRKAQCDGDFKAVWTVADGEAPIEMNMWMAAGKGREIYLMDAPYTTLYPAITPEGASAAPSPTPTIIVRQENKSGWDSPFAAVYQPAKGNNGDVRNVACLKADKSQIVMKIESDGNRKDLVFSSVDSEEFPKTEKCHFIGSFGVVSEKDGVPTRLYMVDSQKISNGKYSITSAEPVSASIYMEDGKWHYSSTGDAQATIGGKKYALQRGFGMPLED
ncbi:MAG: hypothetical protein NC102_01515 [Clostridium sp.]|nr:hypothetical protein [Clostridium sp.]